MITAEAQRRAQILTFWRRHGLSATQDAHGVSRPTLFRWQRALREANGRLEALNPDSRAPRRRRKRVVDPALESFLRTLRTRYPYLGRDKCYTLAVSAGLAPGSPETVGRIIKGMVADGRIPPTPKVWRGPRRSSPKTRRKGYVPTVPGDLVALDTIVIYACGRRYYVLTAIDLVSRQAWAMLATSATSRTAKRFIRAIVESAPFTITRILTDNGSEFEKFFRLYTQGEGIVHFHTYPRSPKQNAMVERFNGSIQRECLNFHIGLLSVDSEAFEEKLREYLAWYNAGRPHWGIGLKTPQDVVREYRESKD